MRPVTCVGRDLSVLIAPRPPIESNLGLESGVHIQLARMDPLDSEGERRVHGWVRGGGREGS